MYSFKKQGGFILLFALVLMVTLLAIVAGYLYLVSVQTRVAGSQLNDTEAFDLAEAGIERGIREIRDDVLSTTQIGIADLRGYNTQISGTVSNPNNVRYFDESATAIMTPLRITPTVVGSTLDLWNYDLNYLGARIRKIQIGCRYRRSGNSGNNPFLEISYTTNGIFPQTGNSSFTTTVSSTNYNNSPFIVLDVTNDAVWDWAHGPQAVWQQINNSKFRVRACAYTLVATKRMVEIDYLFVKVDYEIDTNIEAWARGSYVTLPVTLGDGTIETILIISEQGKVHLNTASQSLLRYLMAEHGIPGATANTLATRIVSYRTIKPFDSVEELQQVLGMTAYLGMTTYYELIRDDVTVYSFINAYATRPTGNRAPININTASREVLEAIFDPLGLDATDPTTLANDIITTRATNPFSCFYSSDATITSDFYDFVRTSPRTTYLTTAQQNGVLDNADASLLVPVSGYGGYNAATTEFCYDTNSFTIEALGQRGDSISRLRMIIKDSGNRYLDTYVGDTVLTKYWRQIE